MDKKTITNNKGFTICCVCGGCDFCCTDKMGNRVCIKGHGHVEVDDSCDSWEMRPVLEKVGQSSGEVKTKHYFDYVLERHKQHQERIAAGEKLPKLTALQLRKEYREEYGRDIYFIYL